MENLLKINSRFGFDSGTMIPTRVGKNFKVKVNSDGSKKLKLILNDVQENYEVFIKDIYGAVLFREYFHKSETSNEFDLNFLSEGNYYVEIVDQSTINMIPFVVHSSSTLFNDTSYYKLIKNSEFGTMSLKIA